MFGQRQLGGWLTPATPEGLTLHLLCRSSRPRTPTASTRRRAVLVMPPAKPPRVPHRWLQRLWLVVFVLFCLEIGILLTVLPWTRLWTDNSLLIGFPAVKEFLSHNFVRGLVSGLGLVDIWMGVAEAVTYRESPRS